MEPGRQYEINYGYMMMCNGFKNSYDEMPKVPGLYEVEDHAGHRFTCEAVISFGTMVWFPNGKNRGYDIIWWKERGQQDEWAVQYMGLFDGSEEP